jgi:competence protein ComEC
VVKIIFKNVNQGDSIIIEWSHDNESKYGIIDCSKYNSKINPVLEHVISEEIKKIDFLLLTHPHEDHFSGFYELISHCRKNNVEIKRFLYTSRVSPDYLKLGTKNSQEGKRIIKLFKLIIEMQNNDELLIASVEDNGLTRNLDGEFSLEFLAPSNKEFDAFINSGGYGFNQDKEKDFDGNWLSTIINIFSDKCVVLLTSDTNLEVYSKLNKTIKKRHGEIKLILGQVPHHGSKENFHNQFWTSVKKTPNTYAVISVGKNDYKHPTPKVVTFFEKHENYNLLRTDSHSIGLNPKASQNSLALGVASTKVEHITYSEVSAGDKSFIIENSKCTPV